MCAKHFCLLSSLHLCYDNNQLPVVVFTSVQHCDDLVFLFVSAKLVPANQQGEIQGVVTLTSKHLDTHGLVGCNLKMWTVFCAQDDLVVCTCVHVYTSVHLKFVLCTYTELFCIVCMLE